MSHDLSLKAVVGEPSLRFVIPSKAEGSLLQRKSVHCALFLLHETPYSLPLKAGFPFAFLSLPGGMPQTKKIPPLRSE